MKFLLNAIVVLTLLTLCGCERVSQNAVDLAIDFSWEGMSSCGWGNPTIFLNEVPKPTKYIKIWMYDNEYRWDHGEVIMPYKGETVIEKGRFKEIQGPCPPRQPGQYEITIKALDQDKVVIGIGSKERPFPEKMTDS
jgi:hypothetical protein